MPVQVKTAAGQSRLLALPEEGAATAPGGPGRPAVRLSVAQLVYLSGFFEPPALCSALGRCARCRVRFLPESSFIPPALEADFSILGPEAVAAGWRLGCRHQAESGQVLELPPEVRLLPVPSLGPLPTLSGTGAGAKVGLAVDFGSTSLCAALVRGCEVTPLAPAANPQSGAGSDIMSRLAWAADEAGRERLQALSLAALRRLLEDAASRPDAAGNPGAAVAEIVLAANPAMTYLLFGLDVSGLSAAPYRLDYQGGRREVFPALHPDQACGPVSLPLRPPVRPEVMPPVHQPGQQAAEPNNAGGPGNSGEPDGQSDQGGPGIWVCPLVSPFIGGDVTAGYAALALGRADRAADAPCAAQSGSVLTGAAAGPEYPFILADLGTNGEFLLALDRERALAASLPLGPALEGMGMCCGAVVNAQSAKAGRIITRFCLDATGLHGLSAQAEEPRKAAPGGPMPEPPGEVAESPTGISATGYLSLLHKLRRLGLLDENGHFYKAARPADLPLSPLARKLLPRLGLSPAGEPAWMVDASLYVSAGDVEELLKVKAAFNLAFAALLESASLAPGDLQAVYLAGALGRHLEVGSLTGLGFLPEKLAGRIYPVGNTALAGAILLAKRPDLRAGLVAWARGVRTVELTGRPDFQHRFAAAMTFA